MKKHLKVLISRHGNKIGKDRVRMKKRALIAMSGGVDSSVAALLTKEKGYDCIGVTMKLYENEEIGIAKEKTCCTLSDVEDAREVAAALDIPYYVFNFKDSFQEKVIDKFITSYQCGCTPNPCIDCNRYLKFAGLYQRAKELECDVIVTGHYARIEKSEEGYHLFKGKDESKDQSYVLYTLTQEQLAHTEFPLGALTKEEVRKIAARNGFVNAQKKESQDICFIPNGDYRKFIEQTGKLKASSGIFTDRQGNLLGKHEGYYRYTIGQRKGLGIPGKESYYVVEIVPEKNQVVLGKNEDLFHSELIADDFNWMDKNDLEGQEIQAKVRYGQKAAKAVYKILGGGKVQIQFEIPQRAFTRGQAVVLYQGERVLGGGTIVSY